jgi:CPA2 family monovalent cation:H+ antiporter-2
MGSTLGILPEMATSALVAAAIVSIALNPILHGLIAPLDRWVMRRPRLARVLTPRSLRPQALPVPDPSHQSPPGYRAVVVGYGPVGQTLVRLLSENGVTATVIELNLETVKTLRAKGVNAVYGDARHRDTLRGAGLTTAGSLILSASGIHESREIIRMAREMNPQVRVLVRTAYLRGRADLIAAGADVVFSGEGEVALAMNESVLRDLGATPEQIDREREKLRTDLAGNDAL